MTWKGDRIIGLVCLAFALVLIFVWVPLDTESGLVEKVRRRWSIGDALGPTIAGAVIALGAVLSLLRPVADAGRPTRANLIWMLRLIGVFALSLLVMRYAGPLLAAMLEGGYRPLRDTLPWKYIGFVLGGTVLVAGLCTSVLGRLAWRDVVLGLVASLLIALAYDLPFDDLILPPNGDV